MTHHHTHDHHSHHSSDVKTLFWCFWVITTFMAIEFVAGKWFDSLALVADAGHMANDAFALALSLLSLLLAKCAKKLSWWLSVINAMSLLVIALLALIKRDWCGCGMMFCLTFKSISQVGFGKIL